MRQSASHLLSHGAINMLEPAEPSPKSQPLERLIRIGQLAIDLSTRQAILASQRHSLTTLEFDLLVYLAQHAGQTVSRTELLRQVWRCHDDAGGTAAQVKNCVKRLRQKIEPDPKRPCYLLTVRGYGYRMPTEQEWENNVTT